MAEVGEDCGLEGTWDIAADDTAHVQGCRAGGLTPLGRSSAMKRPRLCGALRETVDGGEPYFLGSVFAGAGVAGVTGVIGVVAGLVSMVGLLVFSARV